jgi:acyl-CoA synthetase (AMP-forming)/AMP-acid ligase II
MPKRTFRLLNIQTKETYLTPRGDLADRILDICRHYSDKILLCDLVANYAGADILANIQMLEPVISKFSRERGRIGILIPNSAGAAMSILTTVAMRRAPVILNSSAKREHIERLLPGLNLDFLIVSKAAYPELSSPCSFLHVNMSGGMVSLVEKAFGAAPPLPREGTAIVLYTSGSTGEPKGVQLSSEAIDYTVDRLIDYFRLNESSVAACILPLFHTMGLNTQFFPTFFAGGKCVFREVSLVLGMIYRRILESKGTFVGLISDFIHMCHAEKIHRNLPPALEVQHVQISGTITRGNHLRMARELFPNAVIHKGFGLTEAIRICMISSKDPNFYDDTVGYPLPEQEIEIRDADCRALPPDTLGEIYVRGPNVMLGYDNISNNFPSKDGFLRTGDLGHMTPDGRLAFHGRCDSIFKVMGERVSGREIENAARSIDSRFNDVKCLPVEFKESVRPVLFLEMDPDRIEDFLAKMEQGFNFKAELKNRLKDNLKIPREVYFMNRFPRTHNGKVSCRDLKDLCFNGGRVHHPWASARDFSLFSIPSTPWEAYAEASHFDLQSELSCSTVMDEERQGEPVA